MRKSAGSIGKASRKPRLPASLTTNQSTVSRILCGVIRTCLILKESARDTARKAALVIRQRQAAAKLAALQVLKAKKTAMREQTEYKVRGKGVSTANRFGRVNEARKRHFRWYFWKKSQLELYPPDPERAKRPPLEADHETGGCTWCSLPEIAGAPFCPYCGLSKPENRPVW